MPLQPSRFKTGLRFKYHSTTSRKVFPYKNRAFNEETSEESF
jgi:hypothetical protein